MTKIVSRIIPPFIIIFLLIPVVQNPLFNYFELFYGIIGYDLRYLIIILLSIFVIFKIGKIRLLFVIVLVYSAIILYLTKELSDNWGNMIDVVPRDKIDQNIVIAFYQSVYFSTVIPLALSLYLNKLKNEPKFK